MNRNDKHEMMIQFSRINQTLNETLVNVHNSMLMIETLGAEVLRINKELKELSEWKDRIGLGMGEK